MEYDCIALQMQAGAFSPVSPLCADYRPFAFSGFTRASLYSSEYCPDPATTLCRSRYEWSSVCQIIYMRRFGEIEAKGPVYLELLFRKFPTAYPVPKVV